MKRYILPLTVAAVVAALLAAVAPGSAWAAPPDNDTFQTATLIPSLPFGPKTVDTTEATTDSDDAEVAAACNFEGVGEGGGYATVWYKFTAPTDEFVKVDARSPSYTTAGAVVTGEPGSFTTERCFLGSTAWSAVAGQTYFIMVANLNGNGGGTLNVSVTVAQPPELQLSVDPVGRFNQRTGAATVTGTVTCTAREYAYFYGNLSQRVGRIATISGYLYTDLDCGDGTAQPWSASVQPSSGMFKGGKANLNAYASLCNQIGCVEDSVDQTIQLRR